jgi:hypothetical protein
VTEERTFFCHPEVGGAKAKDLREAMMVCELRTDLQGPGVMEEGSQDPGSLGCAPLTSG